METIYQCVLREKNKCYACGITEGLSRFHVVPTEYKKLFPEEWKSHCSIDVLPLCQECSSLANSYTQDLKDDLNDEYNVHKDNYIDYHKLELKSLSKKIMNNRKYGL